MCSAGVVGRQDDDWRTEQEHQTLACSSSLGIAVLFRAGTVRHDIKLVNDPVRNVKPVQLIMTDRRQAAVKFPCAADNTSSSVDDTLQLVCHGIWSTGQHDVAIRRARASQLTRSRGNVRLDEVVGGRSNRQFRFNGGRMT